VEVENPRIAVLRLFVDLCIADERIYEDRDKVLSETPILSSTCLHFKGNFRDFIE